MYSPVACITACHYITNVLANWQLSGHHKQFWEVNLLASLLRGLCWTVWTLEGAQLASGNLTDGCAGQHMPTGQHLWRVTRCTLFPGYRACKGAVENELLAQLKVHRQLRRCLELVLLLAADLGGQFQQCWQCN